MAHYTIKHWTTATTEVGSSRDDAIEVTVNNRAAVRQAILDAVKAQGVRVQTRSDWKAKAPAKSPKQDWDYTQIAIHHAGNSFSCSANGVTEMHRVEDIDLRIFGQVSYHYAIDCHGVIYEALDIRYKGSHILDGNTGVIGIVLLADLSRPGEAATNGPDVGAMFKRDGFTDAAKELAGQTKDFFEFNHDVPSEPQITAAETLRKALASYFNIEKLGGHREFPKQLENARACPGSYGMAVADVLRRSLKVRKP